MKKLTSVFICCLAISLFSISVGGAPADMEEMVSQSAQEVGETLGQVLDHVNQGGKVDEQGLEYLKETLRKNIKFVLKMEPADQAKYYLLSSWTNFYSHAGERALKESLKAFKLDPENADVRATVASLAIATGRLASLAPIKMYMKQNPDDNSSGTLKFDMSMINLDMLNKPMPSGTFAGINGEMLELKDDILYAGVMWKMQYAQGESEDRGRASLFGRTNEKDQSEQDYTPEKDEAFTNFAEICIDNADNDKLGLIAINADRSVDKKDLYRFIVENPGPWTQILLCGEGNSFARYFMNVELEKANMIMVYGGKILYFGSADTFLPQLIISTITQKEPVNDAPVELNPKEQETPQDRDEFSPPPTMPGMPQPVEPQNSVTAEPKQKDETEKLVDDIRAQKLLDIAIMDFKRMGMTTYRKGVEACRKILAEYPNTTQAVQAREMLRGLPDRIKDRYDVTDEELGYK